MRFPREAVSSSAFADRDGSRWTAVEPAQPVVRRPPRAFGREVDFWTQPAPGHPHNLDRAYPEMGVLDVRDAYLVGRTGFISARETLLLDHSWYRCHEEEFQRPEGELPVVEVPGITLSLQSTWAWNNYSHHLIDSLPRLRLFEKAGYELESVDQVLCHCNVTDDWEARTLGLPERLRGPGEVAYRVERLIAPSFPGLRRNTPAWSADFLRSRLGADPMRRGRRLYIPRTKSRLVVNEAEVLALLEVFGFERFDPPNEAEAAPAAFAGAEVVVGPNGAGLSHVVFCPPGATLLELIPSDQVLPYYYSLADASGLNYCHLICESMGMREVGAQGPTPFDMRVDLGLLRKALEAICG